VSVSVSVSVSVCMCVCLYVHHVRMSVCGSMSFHGRRLGMARHASV
jgi:hypothetical protein